MMNRRVALGAMLGGIAGLRSGLFASQSDWQIRSTLGLVQYCCGFRRKLLQSKDQSFDLFSPPEFLKHCHDAGAGGMQISLGQLSEKAGSRLRSQAEELGLFIEAIVSVPKDRNDTERFRSEVQAAAWCGAKAIRTTIMPGRRYERFETLNEFHELTEKGITSLKLAAPIVERLRVPLAVENHKDHRTEQRVEILREISSEYVGACVDTGNSIALLEDPLETVSGLAPWAKSVHLKDQALAPHRDGFLLADIPLGQGCLPLKEIVTVLKRANPQVAFSLELITRDPLLVPVYGEKYWATFPDLPATELAKTMKLVNQHAAVNLQQVSGQSLEEQEKLESENVNQSLAYAAATLGLV